MSQSIETLATRFFLGHSCSKYKNINICKFGNQTSNKIKVFLITPRKLYFSKKNFFLWIMKNPCFYLFHFTQMHIALTYAQILNHRFKDQLNDTRLNKWTVSSWLNYFKVDPVLKNWWNFLLFCNVLVILHLVCVI